MLGFDVLESSAHVLGVNLALVSFLRVYRGESIPSLVTATTRLPGLSFSCLSLSTDTIGERTKVFASIDVVNNCFHDIDGRP